MGCDGDVKMKAEVEDEVLAGRRHPFVDATA